MPDLRLRQEERLKSRKQLNTLFAEGRSFVAFPIRFIWLRTARDGAYPVRVAFGVSRRHWKRAVDRNLLKRRMREAYRLGKEILYQADIPADQQIHVLCLYITGEALSLEKICTGMDKGIRRLLSGITEDVHG